MQALPFYPWHDASNVAFTYDKKPAVSCLYMPATSHLYTQYKKPAIPLYIRQNTASAPFTCNEWQQFPLYKWQDASNAPI